MEEQDIKKIYFSGRFDLLKALVAEKIGLETQALLAETDDQVLVKYKYKIQALQELISSIENRCREAAE